MGAAITFSRRIARLPGLAALLGIDRLRWMWWPLARASADDMVLGWGRKRSYRRAETYARRRGLRCISLEDGFLRSLGLGRDEPPLSIVVDDLGIYYDATGPSRLEALIAAPHTGAQRERARALIAAWREARVSKYNHAREAAALPPGPYVLVIDQTLGDASIRDGLADAQSFRNMLDAALAENPQCTVLLKVHPDVVAGRKRGHFDLHEVARMARVQVLADAVHPVSLIEHAQAVYTVTSQVGFEGLLWGKRVRTFGMPFYAGWGLTHDELAAPDRRNPVGLDDLVHAALVEYPRYRDPETGEPCEPERLVAWLGLQRRMRDRFPPQVHALGFSLWKRPIVRAFFQGSEVRFIRRLSALPQGATLVVWGSQPALESPLAHRGRGAGERGDRLSVPMVRQAHHERDRQAHHERAQQPAVRPEPVEGPVQGLSANPRDDQEAGMLIRLEDGFLRSVGLGADLVRPISWVMDRRGIYYDAKRLSDLEYLLQNHDFEPALLQRAADLRQRIVAAGLTKYNLGGVAWKRPLGRDHVILVPGQVETDASIALGTAGIRRNIDLLRAVRESCPTAWIVYKPHPDVVAGLRRRGAGEDEAERWCDEIVIDVAISDLLQQVDEVHVLTSLAGFEALLRGRKVVTWGQPFYAGWGLTEDREFMARRSPRLRLDALVAGVLILYPTYVSRSTRRFATPERALDELLVWRAAHPALALWRKLMRPALRYVKYK